MSQNKGKEVEADAARSAHGGSLSPPPPASGTSDRNLHQRIQQRSSFATSSSPAASPKTAFRHLEAGSSSIGGGHSPAAALPIHLEGRSYRFQNAQAVDSPRSNRVPLSSSGPEDPPREHAPLSSSYTATSNTIRDNTAQLANMALYDAANGEEEEQLQTEYGGGNNWRTMSSDLGSGFQFRSGHSSAGLQASLSTSPRGKVASLDETGDSEIIPTHGPMIVRSPPPIESDSETPRLGFALPEALHRTQRSESNATSTSHDDTGSDFSIQGPPPAVSASYKPPQDVGQTETRGESAPPLRQPIPAPVGPNPLQIQRRTSLGGMPQDILPNRTTSAPGGGHNALVNFQPSSFSGYGGGGAFGFSASGAIPTRSSFGVGALAQAQAQADAEHAQHSGLASSSGIHIPGFGGFGSSGISRGASGVGGRRSSIARPSAPNSSALSIHRTFSQGRRSLAHGSNPADSMYGSVDEGDEENGNIAHQGHYRGRHGGSLDVADGERRALLGSNRSWRAVLGEGSRRGDSSPPRTGAAKILGVITYPVRAVGSLFRHPRSRSHSRSPARSAASEGRSGAIGARHTLQKMAKIDLKAALMEPIAVLPAVILGLLLNLLDGVSYGMIIFPNNNPIFSHFGGDGVAMFFVTCIISQLIYTLGGSVFKAGNGSMMIEVVPFYHILVRKIIDEIGEDNPAAVIATTCMAFALSSVLTGIVFLVLGLLRLGVLIGFFPRHILVGCIGGVGIFLIETGFEVAGRLESENGFQYNWETLKYFFQSTHMITLWIIPLALAVFLRVVTAHLSHPLVVPAYFVVMPLIFYGIVFPLGYSLGKLRAEGWVFDIGSAADAPFWRFYSYFDLTQTSWMALLATMPTQFALVFLSILHPPLNIPALAVSVGQDDVNTDRELTAHGWSNIIAGLHILIPALGFLIAGKKLEAS
ncbi:hypothetical protein OC845_001387 [Tilletia horrida]|nr:hypothetical protein OC845_001387 [Tilletia horrida]